MSCAKGYVESSFRATHDPARVLLELKLASGLTAPQRPQDLGDVIQLMRVNNLTADCGEQLDPYVQAKFAELWQAAQITDDY